MKFCSVSVNLLCSVLLALVVAGGAGCGQAGGPGEDDGVVQVETTKTIRVGVVLPLSGDLQAYGQSTLDGIQLRADEFNEAGGLDGRRLELLVEDNKGDADQSISAYKKLVNFKKAVAVVGPITSTNSIAVLNDVTASKTPTVSPTATNDTVAPGSPYMFRACYNDSFQGRVVATYAYRDREARRAAVMVDRGSDYSTGLARSFTETFLELGGEVVCEEAYKSKDTEFGTKLAAVKDSGAEVVFVPGYPGEVIPLLKQAQVMGIEATFCGADGWDHVDIITKSGDQIVGSFFLGAFAVEDPRPEVQDFLKAMAARGKKNVGSFEALGYDSVTLLVEAMKQGGPSREAVAKALPKLADVKAVTGVTTMTAAGDAVKEAAMLGVEKRDGKYVKKLLTHVKPE